MKTFTECKVCGEKLFTQTKSMAQSNLRDHIRDNHQEANAEIRRAMDDIAKLDKQRKEIKERVEALTGYHIPGW